jgi:Resolvase, N terminal domain
MTEFVAYYRVSTDRQPGRERFGARRPTPPSHAILARLLLPSPSSPRSNPASVTPTANRPQLRIALDEYRRSRAVLVLACLDRLARNVAFISDIMESGVEFLASVVDMPTGNSLTNDILAAVAEHEREMISHASQFVPREEKRGMQAP